MKWFSILVLAIAIAASFVAAVRFAAGAFVDEPTPIFGVKRGAVAFPGWPVALPASPRRSRPSAEGQGYCMNQP